MCAIRRREYSHSFYPIFPKTQLYMMKCGLTILLAVLMLVQVQGKSVCSRAGEVEFGEEGECVPMDAAAAAATAWLRARVPTWDKENMMTLFGTPAGVDGLDTGLVTVGVNASLHAKVEYPWARGVARDVWYDYNLPYASVNEARSNWRPLLRQQVDPLLQGLRTDGGWEDVSVDAVVEVVNANMWSALAPSGTDDIWFNAGSTPLVFDPMSVMQYGYASCTGISLLLLDALKSVGVCARLAGTPAWHGIKQNGNHNWIEVFNPDTRQWGILEGKPAGGGESLRDPCSVWFCNPDNFPYGANSTAVFAARFDRVDADTYYRMSWDPSNMQVPGVDRTEWYRQTCAACGAAVGGPGNVERRTAPPLPGRHC